MPKVISRSTVSVSSSAPSSAPSLLVYYCICGEFILVIDCNLDELPTRHSDKASIIRCQDSESAPARVFKLNATPAEPVLIERNGRHERQFRFTCKRCNLPIAYQSTLPPAKSGPFLYIFSGALTRMQGQIPQGALDS
ncbi:hypothetical protein D9757_002690 [Collybiopsis confluens]|uniref:STEEP1 domain-containing protein n=1 Tax=Collybiopsis confluens TaxID=2823264 RepID=A0A8H5HW76_9AGAR|nr:hypothetical protein D9757_002690 [Collybiopsis confluens]